MGFPLKAQLIGMSDFKELKVWQKAHALALAVDRVSNSARSPAYSSLRSQTIRAAMSIDANIAEGRGRRSDRDLIRFLRIAIGSSYELEAHLIMGKDLRFVKQPDFETLYEQLVEVRRMLFGLIKYLSAATRA
jgi:four helix bundle protein